MTDIKKYAVNKSFVRGDCLDIRVVIEWNPIATTNFVAGGGVYNLMRPFIVAERMPLELQLPKDFTIMYYNWDNENVNVPATTDGTQQQASYKLQAFNNKNLGKLIYINKVVNSGDYNPAMLQYFSKAMYKETINFDFKGQLIAQKGINTPARKLQYLSYVEPSFTTPVSSNSWLVNKNANIFGAGFANPICNGNISFGAIDFMKQQINSDLMVYYQRTGNALASYPFLNTFNILFYGQTSRMLQCKGGVVTVSNLSPDYQTNSTRMIKN
jgi:hypothetical protein